MASVTEKPQPDGTRQRAQRSNEQLVDQQISRTRRALKLVDFIAGMITLAIGVVGFLLIASVFEHWVIPGGWSDTARSFLFGALVLGICWYSWRTFWPLLGQSINPAYAAQAIEQSSPSLKNSLLNFLLLRNRKRHLSRQVYQAIEQQAAQRLSQVSFESVVDRSAILRLGYLLVAIVAICALYRFLSPKDLLSSSARVLMPWSRIATPRRVQILGVSPGDAKAARGEQLNVTAEVLGLKEDEPVRLFYSTADEQIVGQEIRMSASAGGSEFQCQVPARIGVGFGAGIGGVTRSGASGERGGGIQQDFSYWIEAGDAHSPRYQVAVFARPTLVVNRLRYDYPDYTGYPSRDVEHTGDIRAVEGTLVTLFAQANKPIKNAHVDFEADGRRDLLMNTADQQASVTFPLSLRDDRRTPRYQSYVLRYLTTAGNQNARPPKYQIDVQPDYSPEIQLLLPEEPTLDVALNQEVNFELEARDPDFALSKVLLIGKVGEQQRLQEELLARNHTGRFVGKLRKTPAEIGLKVGDIFEYWGGAADNRRPEANLAYSAHRKLRVVGPWRGNQQDQQGQEGQRQDQPGEADQGQEGEGGPDGQAGGGEQGNAGEGETGAEGEAGSGQETGQAGDTQEQQQGQGGEGNSAGDEQAGSGNSQGDAGGDSPSRENEQSESSDDGADGEGGGQGNVSSAGDDDGSAFERMADHFKEQEGEEGSEQTGKGQSGEGEAADQENRTKSDRNAADGSPDADQTSDGQSGKGQSGKGQAADGQTGNSAAAENGDDQQGDQAAGKEGAKQDRKAEGAGAQGQPAPGEEEKQGDAQQQQQQQGESPDGQMSPEQGDAGGGDSSGDDSGTPNPAGANRPQNKQGDESDAVEQKDSAASSQGQDKTESDSEGGQSGDQSGGGQEGAGQQAKEDGKGGAGEHQAADDGAGQASETGEGESGEQPGDKQKATGETGESSGDQAGEGSKQAEPSGEKPGGETASGGQNSEQGNEQREGQPEENSDQQPTPQQSPAGETAQGKAAPADAQGQAGDPSGTGGNPSAPPPGGETQPGDAANLEYARKQTDLILDRLDDQLKKQEVDQSLLEKLGWSKDELRRFVDRWKNLKRQADDQTGSAESSNVAKDELNDALLSLGLGRNRPTGFSARITKDKLRDLQDSFRGQVPLEFQEQVRSYIKGTAMNRTAADGQENNGTPVIGTDFNGTNGAQEKE